MMKIKTNLLPLSVVGAAISAFGWATPTHALTVFGNPLNPSPGGAGIDGTLTRAVNFRTSASDWTINSVVLSLSNIDAGDVPIVEIRGNSGTAPDSTVVATLINPSFTGLANVVDNFTFNASGVALTANTDYWLVVSGENFSWSRSTGSLPTASNGSGWTSPSGYRTSLDGTTWGASGNNATNANAFQIDANEITPIPFAFTPIPGLIVSGIIGGVRRARNKARRAIEA
jgi:hypothetical protein